MMSDVWENMNAPTLNATQGKQETIDIETYFLTNTTLCVRDINSLNLNIEVNQPMHSVHPLLPPFPLVLSNLSSSLTS